ncbi:HAD-IIA family hydrolase [Falsarthrobacter nasiphocae]|uniref:HAD superfamily hydrolase (TIGR01450 family) n=1 Tax=Falsarthrobacter nasiphocae TaxID=189863 RepID=A0AAE3YIN0_9MICC|nr:HAD-IIA family hydrolase [Falsarthrobacter nasiphocae]MDR6892721.1 HAD superfamily hydrolase (TIGR01450 family) [Falsarthrobacter nasiphocae]
MTFIEEFDGFLFDLDGVVYAGQGAIDGAPESITALRDAGRPVGFVTNNASRSEADVAAHLRELGVPAEESTVFGSARTAMSLLDDRAEKGARVFVVGSPSLADLVTDAGFTVVGLDAMEAGEGCDVVVQGFSPETGWRHLAAASYAIEAGADWIATNMDATIPRAEGIAPGNGSLVEGVRRATGRDPVVAGKPEPAIFHRAAKALGCSRPLVVGDRLDTDIAGGRASGFASALVLTGIDSRESAEAASADQRPDFVIGSLRDLVNGEASSFSLDAR